MHVHVNNNLQNDLVFGSHDVLYQYIIIKPVEKIKAYKNSKKKKKRWQNRN